MRTAPYDGGGARERVVVVGDAAAARTIGRVAPVRHEVHAVAGVDDARAALADPPPVAVVFATREPREAARACTALLGEPGVRDPRGPCALLAVPVAEVDAAMRLCADGVFDDYLVLDAKADPHRPALVLRHALERRRLRDGIAARLEQLDSIRRDIGESGSRLGRRLVLDAADPASNGRLAVDVAGAFARADLALGGCARALGAALEPIGASPAPASRTDGG